MNIRISGISSKIKPSELIKAIDHALAGCGDSLADLRYEMDQEESNVDAKPEQRGSTATAEEVIRKIQNRNYGMAEMAAKVLIHRLRREEGDRQREAAAMREATTVLEQPNPGKIVLRGEDETVIAEISDVIRALPDGIPLIISVQRNSDEADLERLVRMREGAVGIDLKRINHKIAELQTLIDNQRRRQ